MRCEAPRADADRQHVSGNSTAGIYARGGGIYSGGNVTLTNSTVSGNSTRGEPSRHGGGIFGSDIPR